jgi:polyphosphate kinase
MTAPTTERPPAAAGDTPRYLNRELSWLDFNGRVLELAEDERTPLLERAKFLAIFTTNLDEFFEVRVAGVKDQLIAGLASSGIDGATPTQQLRMIRQRVEELNARHAAIFREQVAPALADAGVQLVEWAALGDDDHKHLREEFEQRIFPVLTPLAVDPGHPFPYISNLSLNLAVIVRDRRTGDRRFARVKVPPLLPRFVVLPDLERYIPLEQVIAAHLGDLFPGMDVVGHYPFRVTRDADLALEEGEADDLLAAVEMELRRRRFGEAVRLEVQQGCTDEVQALLTRELDLDAEDVYVVDGPLDLSSLWLIHDVDRPDLKDEPWTAATQPGLATAIDEPADLFALLRDRDVLVHHPYDSFTTSVEAFIKQAAEDPDVLAIKQTLYRTSGDSPILKSLIRAAEAGKQVATLVELKARFDEQNNIAWARALEEVGVHVVYGLIGLKTHSKTALVVRQEADGIRRYCHIGTGNYNPKTARLYEDVGILTADADVGADLSDLFNMLTGYSRQVDFRRLLLAPATLRDRIIDCIRAEAAAEDGRIVMKMNALADAAVIDALYEASRAGAQIDLIVRGICCLRPGVKGLSDNIRVRSIVGRNLEHSRIFAFRNGGDGQALFIGSPDMMPRNLDRRIEVAIPVLSETSRRRLYEILELNLADDTNTWTLGPDGQWQRVETVEGVSAQARLYEMAQARAKQRRDDLATSPSTTAPGMLHTLAHTDDPPEVVS